jgi:hypothetical protein
MLSLFIRFELDRFKKYLSTKTLAKSITMMLFLMVFVFVGVGIYFFFLSGFRFIRIEATDDIRLSVSLFLYESFLLLFSVLLVLSSAITTLFNAFKRGENDWIIASPSYAYLPRFVFLRSLVTASLPLLVVFLPAGIAFQRVHHLGVVSILLLLLSVFLLLVTLNAVTFALIYFLGYGALCLSRKVPSLGGFSFGRFVFLLCFLFSLSLVAFWGSVRNIDIVAVIKAETDVEVLPVSYVADHFSFAVTHPFAMELLSLETRSTSGTLLYFFSMVILALFSFVVFRYSARYFYPVWLSLGEHRTTGLLQKVRTLPATTFTFSGSPMLALFKKEVLVTTRNMKGVIWFFFLFLLWCSQVGANTIMNNNVTRHSADISEKTVTLIVLQFVVATYFISAFVLRFVFPSFSSEKKYIWILGSAPVNFKRIFFGKYFFFVAFFVSLALLMSYINSAVFSIVLMKSVYATVLLVTAVVTIVTLAIILGAVFPNKETDDPDTATTSMAGLSFTALALIYGGFSAKVLLHTLKDSQLFLYFSWIFLSMLLVIVLLMLVPHKVGRSIFSYER